MSLYRLLTVLMVFTGVAHADPDPRGVIAIFNSLPGKYLHSVIKISADSSRPFPSEWTVQARDYNGTDALYRLTVVGGQIVSEKPEIRQQIRSIFTRPHSIDGEYVRMDANDVWRAAVKFASNNHAKLASVHYVLQQKAGTSPPIWTVTCYDRANAAIGTFNMLATTGAVFSAK